MHVNSTVMNLHTGVLFFRAVTSAGVVPVDAECVLEILSGT